MNNLRTIRQSHRLTLKEMAEMLGVSESAMSLYENDRRHIPNAMLIKLSGMFNVSTDYILGATDTPEKEAEQRPQLELYRRKGERMTEEQLAAVNTFLDQFLS